jgi:hypothetical protein
MILLESQIGNKLGMGAEITGCKFRRWCLQQIPGGENHSRLSQSTSVAQAGWRRELRVFSLTLEFCIRDSSIGHSSPPALDLAGLSVLSPVVAGCLPPVLRCWQEFEASLDYIATPCLKKIKSKTKSKSPKQKNQKQKQKKTPEYIRKYHSTTKM